jgi:SAM-dependent methyltransferase
LFVEAQSATMTHWADQLFREQADDFAGRMEGRFEEAATDVGDLLALLDEKRDHSPDSVLDLGCGIGRHVVPFAEAGVDADGIDFSEEFLARGRERARETGVGGRTTFHHADLRELDDFDGEYDLVTSFWNSIGYYDRETDRETLAAARDLLSPEGRLVVEMTNKAFFLTNFSESDARESEEGLVVERAEYDPTTGRHRTEIDHFDRTEEGYEHTASTTFEPRLYAPVELRELCEDAGFDEVSLHAGFEGGDVTVETPTVVVLAG